MKRQFATFAVFSFFFLPCATAAQTPKEMIEYFKPIPVVNRLTSDTWGDTGVVPRDVTNGLESRRNEYHYWDGKIIATSDGKYHMHCSRWPKSSGFGQWGTSVTVHAVSNSLLGPYVDQGPVYERNGGQGHNVSSLELPDGGYAIHTSDVTPGDFYTAPAIDGPWTYIGSINIDYNGINVEWATANISVVVRPDNTFLATHRRGHIYLGTTDLLGPYVVQGPSVWPAVPGLDNERAEDPVIWYSGGYYHITVNWWDTRIAHHLMSKDGINDWQDMGVAYDPRAGFIRYTDGTVSTWHNLERPGVVMENGHVVAFTFAATDADKHTIAGTDNHGSKILVVPFDGEAFDADHGGVALADRNNGPYTSSVPAHFAMRSACHGDATLTMEFSLPHPANVTVDLYDLSGRSVRSLVNNFLPAGTYGYTRHLNSFTQGCYAVRLQSGPAVYTDLIRITH